MRYPISPYVNVVGYNPPSSRFDSTQFGRSVYFVNYPSGPWHKHLNIRKLRNYSIDKKNDIIKRLGKKCVFVVSPTESINQKQFISYSQNHVEHVGSGISRLRLNQFSKALKSLSLLVRRRSEFEGVLVYNVEFPYFWIFIVLKLLFRKKIYLEIEDDYFNVSKSRIKRFFHSLSYSHADLVFAPNKNTLGKFKCDKFFYNGVEKQIKNRYKSFQEGCSILIGANRHQLKEIELIKDFYSCLERDVLEFTFYASKELKCHFNAAQYSKIEYFDYFSDKDYSLFLNNCNFGLILDANQQHEMGFFPSKVLDYINHNMDVICFEYKS